MDWKAIIKNAIPPSLLNNILLTFPFLYRTKIVNYETNIPTDKINDLLLQINYVLELQGNIIECGSSRCGTSIIVANYLQSKCIFKTIYACDSFEGFDQEELRRERDAGLTTASESNYTSISYEYVTEKIKNLRVRNIVIPVKGFFQTTLPHIESGFCFALVDCDLRDSLVYCAEAIWPKLVSKGRILFDDYAEDSFKGARLGIDYFVDKYSNEIEEHSLQNGWYVIRKT